ncbi:MAG: cyclase family protein [Dehalococcoidia bacterium]
MKFEYFLKHVYGSKVSRRKAMRVAARMGAAGGLAALGASAFHDEMATIGRSSLRRSAPRAFAAGALQPEPINDDIFDAAAVEGGAWAPGPYGAGDQRGALNEVTPEKTASALRLLDAGRPVHTYNLGEQMFNGFPAFATTPPRLYDQRLTVSGYQPPSDFEGFFGSAEPGGPNRISGHEERFPNSGTYQIGTQLDNLNHVGVGEMFYNGFRGPEIARTWGTAALGAENMGPIVTRGVLLDIVGLKVSQGATGDYFTASGGGHVLRDNYRITVEDIEAALERRHVTAITPGDVVLLRTGWTHLVSSDPERYLMQEPGIYLREARYLAQFRPAIIGGDAWALEVLDPAVTQGNFFPVHQLLFVRHGIRIGEGIVTEELAEDGVFEFVYIVTPPNALGATAGNTPPAALGQPSG